MSKFQKLKNGYSEQYEKYYFMPLAGLSIHRIIREGIEISEELANFRYIRKKSE